ncbi:hypothetical protein DPMN_106907 [Dreissena polymorpha]|uniref:Uncharacterized protein n=1 Tax=Dreissena polymorpha TaxID=45954 RepID=A0A9D4QKB3_DREPO|nr:hypothetical protein DPMN_106907 [Dreissena polymorpha]
MKLPPWHEDEVNEAKTKLNQAKEHLKRRNTEDLLENLRDKERQYDDTCESATTKWVENTCEKINRFKDPKQK